MRQLNSVTCLCEAESGSWRKKTCRYLTQRPSRSARTTTAPEAGPSPAFGEMWEMTTSDELGRIVRTLSAQLQRGACLEPTAESARSCRATAARDSVFWRLLLDELSDILGARRSPWMSQPSLRRRWYATRSEKNEAGSDGRVAKMAFFAVTRRRRVVFLRCWFRANRRPYVNGGADVSFQGDAVEVCGGRHRPDCPWDSRRCRHAPNCFLSSPNSGRHIVHRQQDQHHRYPWQDRAQDNAQVRVLMRDPSDTKLEAPAVPGVRALRGQRRLASAEDHRPHPRPLDTAHRPR